MVRCVGDLVLSTVTLSWLHLATQRDGNDMTLSLSVRPSGRMPNGAGVALLNLASLPNDCVSSIDTARLMLFGAATP